MFSIFFCLTSKKSSSFGNQFSESCEGGREERRGEERGEERREERGPLTVVCNAVNHVFPICPSVHPHQEGADLSTTRMFAVYCFLCNWFCCCSWWLMMLCYDVFCPHCPLYIWRKWQETLRLEVMCHQTNKINQRNIENHFESTRGKCFHWQHLFYKTKHWCSCTTMLVWPHQSCYKTQS